MVIVGSIMCIIGGAAESKPLGIIGGILIIVGPLLLIVDLIIGFSDISLLELAIPPGSNLIFGSESILGGTLSWGIWIGFFMAIAGGVLGLIGGATTKSNN